MAFNAHGQQAPVWDFTQAFNGSNGAGVDHTEQGNSFPFIAHGGPQGGSFSFSHQGSPHIHGQHYGPPPNFFGSTGAGGFGGRGGWGGRGGFFGGPEGRESWGGRGGRYHRGPGEADGEGVRGGHRGRHCGRGSPGEDKEEGEKSRTASPNEEGKEGEACDGPAHQQGRHGRHGRGGRRGGWGHHGHRGPPPDFGGPGVLDLSGLYKVINAQLMAETPFGRNMRQFAEQAGFVPQESGETDKDDSETFIPPVDIFSTETSYVLHISLPGAKKEDVGVNWDAEKGVLNIAGVVYRQGEEEFLKTLRKSERKVGMFERTVKLPPGSETKEEVDSDAITAKLEDGILMVTVPKVEKDWTEVKRVDIE